MTSWTVALWTVTRSVLLLPLIMDSLCWNCGATMTDVSQMLWLSFSPHSRECNVLSRCPIRHSEHFRSANPLRVARNIGGLEQITLTLEGFGLFGMLVFRAESADPNVKVNPVNDPLMPLDYIVNSSTTVSANGSTTGKIAVGKSMQPRSEWYVGRRGRKAWLKRRGRKTCLPDRGLSQMVVS